MLIVYLILYAQKAQDNYASISYSLALYLMDCRLNLGLSFGLSIWNQSLLSV